MVQTLFFYDLETSGINARSARIMQFAGQRTDLNLNSVGDPINYYIALTPDILPDPEALLVTGITPQKTIEEGYTEAQFLDIFYEDIATEGTIFVGYNNVRFDDEFMRFLNWRNFYDAYKWQWAEGRSKWDLLDLVRMTRALRPEGIKWPFAPDGKPSNRLEYMTSVNKLSHESAHDALSDVNATIALAKQLKTKQSKLFDYLLDMRDKKKVEALVGSGQPFVYSSGRYSSSSQKTTVVVKIADTPEAGSAWVYDLQHDPSPYLSMTTEELASAWKWKKDNPEPRLPVKVIKYNRCPAVAPLSVLDVVSQDRLSINLVDCNKNLELIANKIVDFTARLEAAAAILAAERVKANQLFQSIPAEELLYDGFVSSGDTLKMSTVRNAKAKTDMIFKDERLNSMLPHYLGRNYPNKLNTQQLQDWRAYCKGCITKYLPAFEAKMVQALSRKGLTKNQTYALQELKLYVDSLL